MESRTISKKNIDKILKFIKLNEEKEKKDNKKGLNETGNDRSEKGNG
jgi:hypothetical protein